eukprot:g75273.t1
MVVRRGLTSCHLSLKSRSRLFVAHTPCSWTRISDLQARSLGTGGKADTLQAENLLLQRASSSNLEAHDKADLLWELGKLFSSGNQRSAATRVSSDPRLATLVRGLARSASHLRSEQLCRSLAACYDLQLHNRTLLMALSKALQQNENMAVKDLAIALKAAANLQQGDPDLIKHLLDLLQKHSYICWQDLCSVSEALTALLARGSLHHSDNLLPWLLQMAVREVEHGTSQTLVSFLWLCAKLIKKCRMGTDESSVQSFSEILAFLPNKLPSFNANDLCNSLVALTILMEELWAVQSHPTLCHALLSAAQYHAEQQQLDSDSLSMVVHSLATMGIPSPNAFSKQAQAHLGKFSPGALTRVMMSVALCYERCHEVDVALVETLMEELTRRADLDSLTDTNISMALRFVSQTPSHPVKLMKSGSLNLPPRQVTLQALLSALQRKASLFSQADLATSWAALARLRVLDDSSLSALTQASVQSLRTSSRWRDAELAALLSALAELDIPSPELVQEVIKRRRIPSLSLQGLTEMLHAVARLRLGEQNKDLFLALRWRALQILRKQEFCSKRTEKTSKHPTLTYSSKDIANLMAALVKLHELDRALLNRAAEIALRHHQAFSTDEVIMGLHAIASVSSLTRDRLKFGELEKVWLDFLESKSAVGDLAFRLIDVARMLEILVFLRVTASTDLCTSLGSAMRESAEPVTDGKVVSLLSSLARLRSQEALLRELKTPLCDTLAVGVPHFNPNEVSQCFKGLARLQWNRRDDGLVSLVRALCQQGTRLAQEFRPDEIDVTLSAMAWLEVIDEELLEALCIVAFQQAASFSPGQIASTLHSLIKLAPRAGNIFAYSGFATRELVSKFCTQATLEADTFSSSELLVTKNALELLDYRDDRFTAKVTKVVEYRQRAQFDTEGQHTPVLSQWSESHASPYLRPHVGNINRD